MLSSIIHQSLFLHMALPFLWNSFSYHLAMHLLFELQISVCMSWIWILYLCFKYCLKLWSFTFYRVFVLDIFKIYGIKWTILCFLTLCFKSYTKILNLVSYIIILIILFIFCISVTSVYIYMYIEFFWFGHIVSFCCLHFTFRFHGMNFKWEHSMTFL